jgi:bacillolysin
MSARKLIRVFMLITLSVATIVSLLSTAVVAEPSQPSARAVAQLQSRAAGALQASYDPRYGNVTFFMGPMPYAPSAAVRGNALATAIEFLVQNKDLYQMQDPARELALLRTTSDQLGQVHVRLTQQYDGVPVFARSLYVHLDARGNVIGTNGHYVPGIDISTTPALGADAAADLAVKAAGTPGAVVRGKPVLTVYVDDGGVAHLTWSVEVVDWSVPSRTLYFMAARGGEVVHAIEMLETAKDRVTYDAGNQEELPGQLVGREGEIPNEAGAEAAYNNAGLVYDFYANAFNRDSVDNQGLTLVSTVHYGQNYGNAYWNGQQMVYGDGDESVIKPYEFAYDASAHEMTHGVTDYTAALIYESQSGALNESFSDVMATATEGKNWTIGEDVWTHDTNIWPVPYLRDMKDPHLGNNCDGGPCYLPETPRWPPGQPDKMSEYANLPVDREHDSGGVHKNSGIPNHVAYLFAVGMAGSDAQSLTPAGLEPMGQVWYRALTTYLTESSNFEDFRVAMLKSADDLKDKYPNAPAAMQSALEGVELTGENQGPQAPTPTPQQRGTPVPQPTPNKTAGCTELVQNPGFENRKPDPWVQQTGLSDPLITDFRPHTGKLGVWLGGTDQEGFQFVYQDVAIPANAKQVTLSYWRNLHQQFVDGADTPGEATFQVLLANTNGEIVAEVETFSSTQGDDQWTQSSWDVKKYAGKTVRIAYTANMVVNNISSLFVDDVSLLACTSGTAPTPVPTGNQGITVSGQVVDADTGRGIAGVTLWFLKPGVSATDAAGNGRVDPEEVFTSGLTDRSGNYQLDAPLAHDTVYSVIVIAQGYVPLVLDDAVNTAEWGDATEVTGLDAQMQQAR